MRVSSTSSVATGSLTVRLEALNALMQGEASETDLMVLNASPGPRGPELWQAYCQSDHESFGRFLKAAAATHMH